MTWERNGPAAAALLARSGLAAGKIQVVKVVEPPEIVSETGERYGEMVAGQAEIAHTAHPVEALRSAKHRPSPVGA
jgi:hypothetical protein